MPPILPPGAPPAASVGAFFDMDHTVLRGSSGMLYVRYLLQTRRLSLWRWAGIVAQIGLYAAGIRDFPHVMGRLMAQVSRRGEVEAWQISAEWFDAVLKHYITDAGREQIAWHRSQGHRPALISAATPFAVRPVAEALGLGADYLATALEVVDGRFTGRLNEVCFGPVKVTMAHAYAAAHGLVLGQSYFYSDSHHDLPLMEVVGHPVAVNPNRRLARIAAARGWPVMKFY